MNICVWINKTYILNIWIWELSNFEQHFVGINLIFFPICLNHHFRMSSWILQTGSCSFKTLFFDILHIIWLPTLCISLLLALIWGLFIYISYSCWCRFRNNLFQLILPNLYILPSKSRHTFSYWVPILSRSSPQVTIVISIYLFQHL